MIYLGYGLFLIGLVWMQTATTLRQINTRFAMTMIGAALMLIYGT